MKTRVLILFSYLLMISCSKDQDTIKELDTTNLNFVKYEQILSTINLDLFKKNSKVIFKNELGSEKILEINFSDSSQKQSVNGKEITLPKVAVNYYESADTKYALYFYVATNITKNGTSQNANFSSSIFTNLIKFKPAVGFDHLGDPFFCIYNQNKLLLGKTFESVYSSFPSDEYMIFSELHYSKSLGIVGFRDENNELWVFDRFEK